MRVWIKATSLGWLVGIPVIAGLALLGELLHLGGAQSLVGLGMGLAVGGAQSQALPATLPLRHRWILPTAVGLVLPFLVYDIAVRLGHPLPYSLPYAVALGGLLVGIGQVLLLRPRPGASFTWVFATLAGWCLAAAAVGFADRLRLGQRLHGPAGLVLYLGLLGLGGLLLGTVTGPFLDRLTPSNATG